MRRVLAVRHAAHEPLGNLERQLRAAGLELEVIDCFQGDWVRIEQAGFQPADWAGLVVMGGPMNADETDRYPNLAAEVRWLQAAVRAQLPTLGVCLGAQLLAQSLDRRVYANPVKEIGWYEIELLPAAMDDPLFSGSQQRESVFEWHGDTFDLPAGAVLLARGTTCAHQAFRYGPNAYGLQFHLEMTAEMVADWLAEPCMCGELVEAPYLDPHEISRRAPEGLAAMAPLTERVYGRFAELCVQEAKMER